MQPRAPVVVWQRGNLRIVAVEVEDEEDGGYLPDLVLEERCRDAMSAEAWLAIEFDDALYPLLVEVCSRIDVVPAWVREFILEDLGDIDDLGDETGDAS